MNPFCHDRTPLGVICKPCYSKLPKFLRWDANTAAFSKVVSPDERLRLLKKVKAYFQLIGEKAAKIQLNKNATTVVRSQEEARRWQEQHSIPTPKQPRLPLNANAVTRSGKSRSMGMS
jgi:hypothetical protein